MNKGDMTSAELGRMGGKKTVEKYGVEHMRRISKLAAEARKKNAEERKKTSEE